jgi:hypothetical protein
MSIKIGDVVRVKVEPNVGTLGTVVNLFTSGNIDFVVLIYANGRRQRFLVEDVEPYSPRAAVQDWAKDNLLPGEVVNELPKEDTSINNGGTTSYYDLPLPSEEVIIYTISKYIKQSTPEECIECAKELLTLFPQTLNDLIEFKNMPFWEGEILKAIYALHQRASKDIKGGGILRELNKIIYYAGRGVNLHKGISKDA